MKMASHWCHGFLKWTARTSNLLRGRSTEIKDKLNEVVWRFSHSKNPAKKFSEALLAIKPVYNPLRVDPGDSARNADLEDVDFHSIVNGTQFLPV